MNLRPTPSTLPILAAAALLASAHAQPVLTPLPRLVGNPSTTFVSDDGAWGGTVFADGRWTSGRTAADGTFTDITRALGLPDSEVRRASNDGRTVSLWRVDPQIGYFFYLWSADHGPLALPSGGGFRMIEPVAMNEDATVISGHFADPANLSERGVWTSPPGQFSRPPRSQPNQYHDVQFISSSGHVMVGKGSSGDFRWAPAANRLQSTAFPPPSASNSFLRGMSDDGRIVLGIYDGASGRGAFVWTFARGSAVIPRPSPNVHFDATAMTRSGSLAVGELLQNGFTHVGSAVWTYTGGLVPFATFLASTGADTTGWANLDVHAVSPDGRIMIGTGTLNGAARSWILRGLPAATPCTADFNGDRFIDWADYAAYVDAFERGMTTGDLNEDGMLDFFDYADFIQAFETGC